MSANVEGLFLSLGSRLQGRRCTRGHCPADTTEPQAQAGLRPGALAHGARRGLPSPQLFCSRLLTCPRNPRPWTRRSAQPRPCGGTGPTTWHPRAPRSGASPARRNQAAPWVEPQLGVQFQESEMSSSFCTLRPTPLPCALSPEPSEAGRLLVPATVLTCLVLSPSPPGAAASPLCNVLAPAPGPPGDARASHTPCQQ